MGEAMLTSEKIEQFIEEQGELGHSVQETLTAMGFDPKEEVDFLEQITMCTAFVGAAKAKHAEAFARAGEIPQAQAMCVAAALEGFMVGLSSGYALGLRDS